MRTIKYILISLGGIVALCIALIAFVLVTFDDDDYQKFATRAVAHFTGYEMIIEGAFALNVSEVPTVSASKIRFESPPGGTPSPITHIGKLNIKFALLPLFTGTVVIKELSVDDVSISWVVGETQEVEAAALHEKDAAEDIDIPILESVSLKDIRINLLDTNQESLGIIKLRHFNIDDIRDMGPLFVKGGGGLNAKDFLISGQLGAIVDALSSSKPYPVEVHFETADLDLDISGEVGDLIEGEGLDLNVAGNVTELSNLLQLFQIECPRLGHMKYEARISGNVEAPRATNIDVTISDGSRVEFAAKGSVSDLINGKGLDVGITCSIKDNEINRMLLPDIISDISSLKLKGRLRDTQGDYILDDIHAYGSNDQGLELLADGILNFGDLVDDSPLKTLDLQLRANTETTEAAKRFLVDFLPEMGPVIGTAHLTGPIDKFSLEDLDIIIGKGLPLQVSSQGRIAWIPIDDNPISGIELVLSVRADQTQLLASAFDLPLPELGAVSITSRLFYSDDQLTFDKIDARTVHSDGLKAELSGSMGFNFGDTPKSPGDMNLEITVTAPNLGAAEPLLGTRIAAELGPVQVYAQVTGTPHVMSLENILFTVGEPTSIFAKSHGRVGKIALGEDQPVSGLKIFGTLQAEEVAEYASLMGVTIPNLGPLKGSWRLDNWEGGFDVEDLELKIGKKETLYITSMGKIKSLSRQGEISFAGFNFDITAEAPGITAIPALSNVDLPDLGSLQVKARLIGSRDSLDIKDILLRTSPDKKGGISLKGEILNVGTPQDIELNATFETYTQLWIERYMKRSTPEDHKLLGAMKLTFPPNQLRIGDLKISTEGQKPLSLEVNGTVKKTVNDFEADVAIAAAAKDLSVLESMFGISLPAFRTLAVNGQFKGNEQKAKFKGETHFGETHFKTVISNSRTGRHRPEITIKNTTPIVYLSDLGIYPEASEEESAPKKKSWFFLDRLFSKYSGEDSTARKKEQSKSKWLFSEKTLPLDALKTFNLNLSLDAEKVMGKNTVINNLDFDLVLDDGLLRISPARLGYAEGEISFDSTLDVTGEKPKFKLKATAEDVDMDAFLAHINKPIILGGNLNLAVDLHSAGSSLREMASSLNGEIGYAIENGKIKRDVEMVTADVVDVLTTLHKIGKYQDLNCMTIRFLFEDGIGNSEILFLDTPNVRTRGAAMIDLKTETLDMVIQPKPKKGLPGMNSAIRIHGPLTKPSVRKMPFKEAARLYGEIFAPYIFLPARGLGYLWYLMKKDKGEPSPCLEFGAMEGE